MPVHALPQEPEGTECIEAGRVMGADGRITFLSLADFSEGLRADSRSPEDSVCFDSEGRFAHNRTNIWST